VFAVGKFLFSMQRYPTNALLNLEVYFATI
jgi:hypothetical protein